MGLHEGGSSVSAAQGVSRTAGGRGRVGSDLKGCVGRLSH